MAVTRFHAQLRERIEDYIRKTEMSLADGAATDYAKYSRIVGEVAGMRICIKLCEDIEGDFDERSSSSSSH